MQRTIALALAILLVASGVTHAQRYTASDGRLRVALAKQPFSPTGTSSGPNTMANGGIQQILEGMGVMRSHRGSSTHARTRPRSMAAGNGWGWRWVISPISWRRTSEMDTSPSACSRLALQCRDWSPVCNTPDQGGNRSKSACCGSMRILTSTRLRPRAAAHLEGCPWRSQPVARSSGCDWMHISIRLFRIAIL